MSPVYKEDIRPPAVANAFYPGDPSILDSEIEHLISRADSINISGEIKALVSPHAGYMYSGLIAAAGYKLLKNRQYSVVAIISPSHLEYFPGISVFNGRAYKTPLGLVPVASELTDDLIEQSNKIISSWAGHRNEHALEVQLPFIQKVLQDFSIIPIVMGEQDFDTCKLLGEALAKVLSDESALIVASSDLSHNHSYNEAVALDRSACELVKSFDEVGLMDALKKGESEACGGGPIVTAMIASKHMGAHKAKVLIYNNSGDVTGEHSAVVGYLSAAFGNLE